jgi:hypothetical protein
VFRLFWDRHAVLGHYRMVNIEIFH